MPYEELKLQKMTIDAYSNVERTSLVGTFKAMYNPESLSRNYKNINSHLQGLITSGRANKFIMSGPTALNVTLLLDDSRARGYIASGLGESLGSGKLSKILSSSGEKFSVNGRLKQLLSLTYELKGDLHQSNYLKVTWGSTLDGFECFLESIDVNYTLFSRSGDPIRAEVSLNLVEDQSVEKRKAKDSLSSPDLTRFFTVKSSNTLPQLAKEIYGDSAYYIQLASANGYDNFRRLTEGSTVRIPPVEK